MTSGADPAREWLDAQSAFWEEWASHSTGEADFDRARAFWAASGERWLSLLGDTLPPPLDAQARAVVDQIGLYLDVATGQERGGDAPALLERWLRGLIEPFDIDPAWADADAKSYAHCVAAYARIVQRLSTLALSALERVRAETRDAALDPEQLIDAIVAEFEAAYREEAASEAFARDVGEWVNARIRLMRPDATAP